MLLCIRPPHLLRYKRVLHHVLRPSFRSLSNMDRFLKESKHTLLTSSQNITIVTGNESCDLDSMSSAIIYSWLRTNDPPDQAFSKIYVPLLNIPREDIDIRPEFKAIFEKAHIDASNLVTLSDLPTDGSLPAERTQWILVDHNKLQGRLGEVYSSRVGGCIDHHDEENAVPINTDPEPRLVKKCGSCTSLVLEALFETLSHDSKDIGHDYESHDLDMMKLGLASILIDTHNLQDINKVEPVDERVASRLIDILKQHDPAWNRSDFFANIDAAKTNLDALPLTGILRKDYKQWTEKGIILGMSSSVESLEFVTDLSSKDHTSSSDRHHWSAVAMEFMQHRKLSLWAIMTAFTVKRNGEKDEFCRELRIHWKDKEASKIVTRFEENHKQDLELRTVDSVDASQNNVNDYGWKTWRQENLAASRKQVGPMLRNTINQ